MTMLVTACGETSPTAPSTGSSPSAVVAASSSLLPSAASSPVPSASIEPTNAPTHASPVPTRPSELQRVFTAEEDGVRVRFELQRNPLPAGELSWVKITVTNIGETKLTWFHGGCASVGTMRGESLMAWRRGEEQPGNLGRFKVNALGGPVFSGAPRRFASFSFVPEHRIGRGSYGCADIGIEETIGPGKGRRETRWWSGFTDLNRALPITGPALLTAHAGSYWRGPEPEEIQDAIDFEFEIVTWIDSPDTGQRKSPGEVIDGALTDKAFADDVEHWEPSGADEIAWYQGDRDIWEVGLLNWYESETPFIRGVEVHPDGGWVVRPLAREWDREVDGLPGP